MLVRATETERARVRQVIVSQGLPKRKSTKAVDAYVNHGRWVADCRCNGAELVAPGEDLLCGSCGTTTPVKFPPNADEIDALLSKRLPVNQNWRGEDVTELIGENIAWGLTSN